MDKNEKIGLLLRVSTQVQEKDGTSLEVQEKTGRKLSEKLGLEPIVFNEGSQSSFKVEIEERIKLVELLDEIENNKIELISYDNSEFNQKLLNDSLPLLKSVIDEKFNSSVEIKLIIDTKVEKIENDEENQVNENDIVNLFEGKDML